MCLVGMDGEEREGQWGRGGEMEREEGGRDSGNGDDRNGEGRKREGTRDEEKEEEFCLYALSSIPVQLVRW